MGCTDGRPAQRGMGSLAGFERGSRAGFLGVMVRLSVDVLCVCVARGEGVRAPTHSVGTIEGGGGGRRGGIPYFVFLSECFPSAYSVA